MSNSVRPHRQKPTRLSRPWDSPGKNTGVGCHFLLQCMKVKSESEVAKKKKKKLKSLSCVRLLATPWMAAYQAPPSIGFSRQEYWSELPLPSLNMLSRLVITFLSRSKHLLILWLQSPSAVVLVYSVDFERHKETISQFYFSFYVFNGIKQ